jgi:hypothetical protein
VFIPHFIQSEEKPTGGFFFDYDREILKRRKDREEREELEENAEDIKEDLDRAIALEFRKKESDQARINELERLSDLAKQHQTEIKEKMSDRVIMTVERAIEKGNFSAMEALDRQLKGVKEEETFLLDAMKIILSL